MHKDFTGEVYKTNSAFLFKYTVLKWSNIFSVVFDPYSDGFQFLFRDV